MANTLILVDRRDYPIKKVTATLEWRGGGYDHVWVDDSGRGQFSGTGTIVIIKIPGDSTPCYQTVNGSSTVIGKFDKSH
ncbi:hypothetical protein JR338_06485 [Chloroflexota bacterium]|nr:hypothetical protein JR338_06485 [Chloroflexota bacterium]